MSIGPGTLLAGRYRLEGVLGQGGHGVVYAARDERMRSDVAIKVLRPELVNDRRAVERLRREASALQSLGHPHLVVVTELVTDPELAYLVMERLHGSVLGAVITEIEGGLAPERVAAIGEQVLDALSAAHEAGLIHRDVKPDNIFLVRGTTGPELAKLLDFGLVKANATPAGEKLTATNSVLGTWQYMSPEQAQGSPLDGRADVYSLGATLYYALTRKRPYQAANMEASMFALTDTRTPPLATQRSAVDPALSAIVERALEKDRARRWESARAMRQALLALLAPPVPRAARSDPDSVTRVATATPPDAPTREPYPSGSRTLVAPQKEVPPPPSDPTQRALAETTLPSKTRPIVRPLVPSAAPPPPVPITAFAQPLDVPESRSSPRAPARRRLVMLLLVAVAMFVTGLGLGRLLFY